MCTPGACGSQKGVGSPETQLQIVVGRHVCAENPGHLQEQQVVLPSELSLLRSHPIHNIHRCYGVFKQYVLTQG